jgi:hypothetical protein
MEAPTARTAINDCRSPILPSTDLAATGNVVMMWTGRCDRNGREVYDGDIITTVFGIALAYWSQDNCGHMINHKDVDLPELGSLTDEMIVSKRECLLADSEAPECAPLSSPAHSCERKPAHRHSRNELRPAPGSFSATLLQTDHCHYYKRSIGGGRYGSLLTVSTTAIPP